MPRKKTSPAKAVEASNILVPSCYIEEDYIEEAITDQRRQFSQAVSLGNGGYVTRAHAMSDEAD